MTADNRTSRVLRSLNRLYMGHYHEVSVTTPPVIPPGAAIIAPNHSSSIDPMAVEFALGRPVCWMMAREYLGPPFLMPAWRSVKVIPVARDGRDSAPTRQALQLLKEGYLLGIFPEGKISPDQTLCPLHPGLALLAEKCQVPVYPVRLGGTQYGQGMLQSFLHPNRISVTFRPPLPPPPVGGGAEGRKQFTELLAAAMSVHPTDPPLPKAAC